MEAVNVSFKNHRIAFSHTKSLPVGQFSIQKKLQKALFKELAMLMFIHQTSLIFLARKSLERGCPPPPLFSRGGRGTSAFAATGCRDLFSPSATLAIAGAGATSHAAAGAAPVHLFFSLPTGRRPAISGQRGDLDYGFASCFLGQKRKEFSRIYGNTISHFWNTKFPHLSLGILV